MAFIITRDSITPKGEEGYGTGTIGPRTARPDTIARLKAGEGESFRLLDGDGIVYYHGLFIDDDEREGYDAESEFQPLDCYGTPNAGCAWIEYRNAAGEWKEL